MMAAQISAKPTRTTMTAQCKRHLHADRIEVVVFTERVKRMSVHGAK